MQLERRRLLTGFGGLGTVAVAGCSSPDTGSTADEAPSAKAAWPTVESDLMSRWKEIDRRKSDRTISKWSVLNVHIYERTIVYENQALRDEVSQKTLGQFDSPLAIFFASHVNLEGNGTSAASKKRIADSVTPIFRSRMQDSGVENVRPMAPQTPKPDFGLVREFRGHYPTPRIEKEVPLGSDLGTRTLVFQKDQLPITGLLTVWKAGKGTAFVGGGAFPAKNFAKHSTISITSEKGDGIDVTASLDLNLRPGQLRRNMTDLVSSVERSDTMA